MEIRLSENIRTFRKARRLTQEQLADALGVTVGAVSKWESGSTTPDLGLIVELAEFFEVSVDVLLGYGWRESTMGETVEQLRKLRREKQEKKGMLLAEKALLKFPNSFEVIYQSAMMYYVQLTAETAPRALELFDRASRLLDQNTDERVGTVDIQIMRAGCYMVMHQFEKAIEILRQNNFDGLNDGLIGFILATNMRRFDEALPYLSYALGKIQTELFRICVGYANAYVGREDEEKALEILLWLLGINRGLRTEQGNTYLDKGDAMLLGLCAQIAMSMGDEKKAWEYLVEARAMAAKFDAAPDYSMKNLRFYHGTEEATAYDDMGQTAMEGVLKAFGDDPKVTPRLTELWQALAEDPGKDN